VAIHGAWNFLNFRWRRFLSQAVPDSQLLDILSILGLFALFCLHRTPLGDAEKAA
jgi:hypothetical protein